MATIHDVLCATNAENPAYSGLRYSFFIAEQFQCSLQVLHAWEGSGTSPSNTYVDSSQILASHRLRERLDAIIRAVPSAGAGRATSHVADGKWSKAVLAFCERQRADLIVLAAPAPDQVGSGADGIDHVVARAACPVLTVPAVERAAPPRLRKMLLAVDADATTGLLVDWAALWASRFDALVQVLYCEQSRPDTGAPRARWQFEVEEKLRKARVNTEICFARPGASPSERVVAEASAGGCDLILMSASLREAANRRVVRTVRQFSPVPVLSVGQVLPDRLFSDPAPRQVDAAWIDEGGAQAAIRAEQWLPGQ